jgi:hypothetical protein
MVRRLPAQARSPRSELSGAGRRADLYSAFGVRRKLGDLRREKPIWVFSATGSSRDNTRNAAKSDVFGRETGYFSEHEDLLAERQGFEPWIPFRVYTLSKRAPSATRPSLRWRSADCAALIYCNVSRMLETRMRCHPGSAQSMMRNNARTGRSAGVAKKSHAQRKSRTSQNCLHGRLNFYRFALPAGMNACAM